MKLLLAGLLLLVRSAASAQADVSLKRLPSAAYELHGAFEVAASSAAVWEVLTDYEGMPSFVASMRSSKVKESLPDGSLVVEQKAVGGMFFLTRTVTILLVVRREDQALSFEDVGRESFWRYEGSWSAEETPTGVRVKYHLVSQPDFIAPSLLMSLAMKRGAADLLVQVRAEIVRREASLRRKNL